MDTRVLRPSDRNETRQAGLCPVPQEPAARRLHDVPVLNLHPPLRQHGERTGAHQAREVVPAQARARRRALHNRQAVRLNRAVLRQEARSAQRSGTAT